MASADQQVELTANEYVVLTLCAGEQLQPGDKVLIKQDMGIRTLEEARGKLTQTAGPVPITNLKNSNYEIVRV